MAGQIHHRSTPAENLKVVSRAIRWRLLLLIPILLLVAFPAFLFGTDAGRHILPSLTGFFYTISGPPSPATPTPMPPFPSELPQPGSILYTVQSGDNCDEILTVQMRMADASQVFSDANPSTVKALNSVVGRNCGDLQPGMVVTLMPQYPLVALGGIVLKVNSTSPQQALPTPLIHVARQQQNGVDCSKGCILTVRIASGVSVHLSVQTELPIPAGAWVWAQATMARKTIRGFDTYPYADSTASFNNMSLRACDFQVNDTHDNNSLSCSQLLPNTINDDGGAWLFGVTSPASLNHWHYNLHLPPGTRVLLWLTADNNGNLSFHRGNQAYRYDETNHIYVKI